MTTYNWKVKNLYTETIEGKEDYVVTAVFDVDGTDGTYSAELIYNTVNFSTEDVTNFIPYSDLTEEIIIGWIKETLGANKVSSLEKSIQAIIDSKINPPVAPENTPLPWS